MLKHDLKEAIVLELQLLNESQDNSALKIRLEKLLFVDQDTLSQILTPHLEMYAMMGVRINIAH
jgi:hypothetical protein